MATVTLNLFVTAYLQLASGEGNLINKGALKTRRFLSSSLCSAADLPLPTDWGCLNANCSVVAVSRF